MYTSRWTASEVRDSASHYGGDEVDAGYAGDGILQDLDEGPGLDTHRAERVLARFTAFRAWLLSVDQEPPALTDHALEAAAQHLAAAPRDWPEGALLRRLLEVPADGAEAAAVLAAAAMQSAWSGEHGGARTLMEAARLAMLRARPDGDGGGGGAPSG